MAGPIAVGGELVGEQGLVVIIEHTIDQQIIKKRTYEHVLDSICNLNFKRGRALFINLCVDQENNLIL